MTIPMKDMRMTGGKKTMRKRIRFVQPMLDGEFEGCAYVKCPYSDITGCDHLMIVRGYCSIGKYCIRDCVYAWMPEKDNA